MKFDSPLIPGRLTKRYKRFLADIVLEDGREITAHTPNTGAMTGCADPGVAVWVRFIDRPNRKYPFSWEISSTPDGTKIGIHTGWANRLVEESVAAGVVGELEEFEFVRREPAFPDLSDQELSFPSLVQAPLKGVSSRLDLLFRHKLTDLDCYVEVKNVTALGHLDSHLPRTAIFPDAVTARGQKHLRNLISLAQSGRKAMMVFCVQREDVDIVSPADEIDPEYGRLLRIAADSGVDLLALGARVSVEEISLNRRLELAL